MVSFHIRQDYETFAFDLPYDTKRLIHDSVTRTIGGLASLKNWDILTGIGQILLARIEAAAGCALAHISAAVYTLSSFTVIPLFLSIDLVLLLFETPLSAEIKANSGSCSNLIYEAIKVNLTAIPVILILLCSSFLNTFVPLINEDNIFFESVHSLVEPLGPLKTYPASNGTITRLYGTLEMPKEFLRALSYKNYLKNSL